MRTILLLVCAGVLGTAATGLFSSYMTGRSDHEQLATFSRIQDSEREKFLPYVSNAITACGSDIASDSPNFGRYAKSAAIVLGKLGELRANRANEGALRENKAAIAKQMMASMNGVSDADFRTVATELLALSKNQEKQSCIIRASVAAYKKA